MLIDPATPFGSRVARRLEVDALAWLVTVTPRGAPLPVPVWFLWDGAEVLLYSKPGAAKLRNVEANPAVALHLEGDGRGGDIVVLHGRARLSDDPPADAVAAYAAKYAWGFARLGVTPPAEPEASAEAAGPLGTLAVISAAIEGLEEWAFGLTNYDREEIAAAQLDARALRHDLENLSLAPEVSDEAYDRWSSRLGDIEDGIKEALKALNQEVVPA